jgi:hypothetical protein
VIRPERIALHAVVQSRAVARAVGQVADEMPSSCA